MPCLNCESKKLVMNRTLNLPVCKECEMIQAYRIYEVKPQNQTRYDSAPELALLISEFNLMQYKDDIQNNYNELEKEGMFSSYDLGTRYCAVIYYTLQDLNIPVKIREYCKFSGVDSRRVFRLAKRISRHFGKVGVFILNDLDKYYERAGIKNGIFSDIIKEIDMTLTRGILGAVFYVNSELTQKEACELFGISLPRLKRNIKKVK
jgi:transcription initiation factor TFIIIB Brf1 subunit/transcription initiation factor TFIIB